MLAKLLHQLLAAEVQRSALSTVKATAHLSQHGRSRKPARDELSVKRFRNLALHLADSVHTA